MPHDIPKKPKSWKRTVPRFKRAEGKPHSTREGRGAEAQRSYLRKHGPQQPRRKTLAVTDKYKEVREKLKDPFKPLRASKAFGGAGKVVKGGLKHVFEQLGGDEKAKPHSTKKGRTASGRRRFKRIIDKVRPKLDTSRPDFRPRPRPLHRPRPGRPLRPEDWKRRKFERPQPGRPLQPREKKGIGGILKGAKNIISKVLKPKGVFKPKPVPKVVTDKPTGWSPKGEYTKADDKKINSMLKKLGDEIKAQPLPPKIQKKLKELQKAYPSKKAEGGRIGLKHGGSAGAAKRGHGAEIK